MEEKLVSFEVAKLAREKGFLEDCFYHYTREGFQMENSVLGKINVATHHLYANSYDFEIDRWGGGDTYCIAAPTQSLLQKWLRDKHDIHINVQKVYECSKSPARFDGWIIYIAGPTFEIDYDINHKLFSEYFATYEDALEKGLLESLKLIK